MNELDKGGAERLVMEGVRICEEHGDLNRFYDLSMIETLRYNKERAREQLEKVKKHFGVTNT